MPKKVQSKPIPVYYDPPEIIPKKDNAELFSATFSGGQLMSGDSKMNGDILSSSKQETEGKKRRLNPIKEMDIVLSQMKARDCQANIAKMQEELRSIMQQRNINTNARISHFHLATVRKIIPKEFVG